MKRIEAFIFGMTFGMLVGLIAGIVGLTGLCIIPIEKRYSPRFRKPSSYNYNSGYME